MKVYYQALGFLGKSTSRFLAYFQAIFQKIIENGYLPSTKHLETYIKLLISCFNCKEKLKGIGLKRHAFNIKYYLHESHLHKRSISTYIRITKLLKKNYFEKFIEELGFVELSTQAKHLRASILHDD